MQRKILKLGGTIMKQRILYLDLLRIIACVMIVFMHSQRPGMGIPAWFLSGSSYVTAAGIGLFFMISGALILGKAKTLARGEELDTFSFLKHRLLKIIIPLAFWSLLYWSLSSIDSSGLGVMWFLWTIGGLYLLSPILLRWLQHASLREVELYLCIWGTSLLYPFLKLFMPIGEGDTSWIYYFHGYVGYFILGYYLSTVPMEHLRKYRWIFASLFLLFTLIAPCAVMVLGLEVDFYSLFWYLSLPIVLQCVAWFVAFRSLESVFSAHLSTCASQIAKLSAMTFGIYLSHILVLRIGLWNVFFLSEITSIPYLMLCALITIFVAWLLTWVVEKVPGGKWVVGI